MKVKFTDPISNQVALGTIVDMARMSFEVPRSHFIIQGDNGERYCINPNSDYNFRFIPNDEADRKFQEALDAKVDEFDL